MVLVVERGEAGRDGEGSEREGHWQAQTGNDNAALKPKQRARDIIKSRIGKA